MNNNKNNIRSVGAFANSQAYITGFTDGEGSFIVSITKNSELKFG